MGEETDKESEMKMTRRKASPVTMKHEGEEMIKRRRNQGVK